jgi:hypothetical protein
LLKRKCGFATFFLYPQDRGRARPSRGLVLVFGQGDTDVQGQRRATPAVGPQLTLHNHTLLSGAHALTLHGAANRRPDQSVSAARPTTV